MTCMHTDALSADERLRYHRHLILPAVGEAGQSRLKRTSVLVVGAGGLGSPVAMYLAAAGVGRIGVMDDDRVELSNLQRQILHETSDLGREKAVAAFERLGGINPLASVECLIGRLDDTNAPAIVSGFDIAVGCVDNFAARYALNRACARLCKPNVFGSAAAFEGQASVFCHGAGPCYQCFFREPPPADRVPPPEEKGVLSSMPGIIGAIQATETLKIILGVGEPLSGRLLLVDAMAMRFRDVRIARDPDCPACGDAAKDAS